MCRASNSLSLSEKFLFGVGIRFAGGVEDLQDFFHPAGQVEAHQLSIRSLTENLDGSSQAGADHRISGELYDVTFGSDLFFSAALIFASTTRKELYQRLTRKIRSAALRLQTMLYKNRK